MQDHSHHTEHNPFLPLLVVLALPILACLALMFIDAGVNRSLFYSAVKTFAILFIVGGAISFAVSRLADRTGH